MAQPAQSKSYSINVFVFVAVLASILLWRTHTPTRPLEGGKLTLLSTDQALAPTDNLTLVRRADDYSCDAKKPCSNGACCGASGYCGYGEKFCGKGCKSNCDATAECGVNAKEKGKKCPLNTCCSEFGFCGTTKEFCGAKCQSNCVEHPKPPGGGSGGNILEKKVIGYYESWAARLDCHKVAPTDLPLDALTHLNYAFAYIDPATYNIVTMDGQTPESLFKDTTDVKSVKPDLKVWVSVGGWTFSDNDTATQPLFGEIAADAGKRQKFADAAVHFMKQYGFDGLDLDWEYPGASDRGGKKEDTANYVKLTETLRKTFDASGSKFGLTFTAPSSYWYLRWFDLPGMVKHVDWINLMTYDLHGVWDATNPIGSIVQGHTNLTEIKLAAELFWRVNVPPAKVAMGFGFYGRAFTLADPKCSKPGCKFKGGSKPGKCTKTEGYLAHYEIQDILNGKGGKRKRDAPKPVHDKDSAVNYLVFDNDQWVSFDDDKTLKQKVDWANSAGLAGGLIWASDQDDNKFSAHKALLGRDIKSSKELQDIDKALSSPQSVIQDLAGSNGQNCFAYKDPNKDNDCIDLDDNAAMLKACGSGFTPVGWDDANCGRKNRHWGKPICCPVNQAPKNCIWRGQDNGDGAVSSDCSAQCRPGEVNIKGIGSSYGGGYLNDGNTNKCGRGRKVFCCPNPDFPQITQGCEMTKCRDKCPTGKTKLFEIGSDCFRGYKSYCCPDPPKLKECRWEGGSGGFGGADCANANCHEDELEVTRDMWGDSNVPCDFYRQKAACCKVNKAPPKPATCSKNLCNADKELCHPDDTPDDRDKRSLASEGENETHLLVKRGRRAFNAHLANGFNLRILALLYPSIGDLFGSHFASRLLQRFFRLIPGYCAGPAVDEGNVPANPSENDVKDFETEHPIDLQTIKRFTESASTGNLPSGANAGIGSIPLPFWRQWNTPNQALGARPPIGHAAGPTPNTINDRIMGSLGSEDYPDPLMAVDRQINGMKGRLFHKHNPRDLNKLGKDADETVNTDSQDHLDELLSYIRSVIATFQYLNTRDAATRFNMVRNQVATQLGYIEHDFNQPDLVRWWHTFLDDFLADIQGFAQRWAREAIQQTAGRFTRARANGRNLNIYDQAIGALEQLLEEIDNMTFPPPNQGAMPPPQPPGGGGGGS